MVVQVWNKKTDINGVEASKVIESYNIKDTDEVFLVMDENTQQVSEIQFKSIICSVYDIDSTLDCLTVAQQYLEKKAEQEAAAKEAAEQEKQTMEEMQQQISDLNDTIDGLVIDSLE